MGDMGGLIAPRKLIIAAGVSDPGFYIKGSRDAYAQAKAAYDAIGMSDRIVIMKDGKITKEFDRSADLTQEEIVKYMI